MVEEVQQQVEKLTFDDLINGAADVRKINTTLNLTVLIPEQ